MWEYLGYQMTLVTVWRTADAEGQRYKLFPTCSCWTSRPGYAVTGISG